MCAGFYKICSYLKVCYIYDVFLYSVALMAAKALSMCVGQGRVTQQLERVLLDAHFASLKILLEQENIIKQAWMTKRCQALSALIRLSCIDTWKELLDMQLKVSDLFTCPH